MIGQVPSTFEPLVAKIQADVGTFLALKQRLLAARTIPLDPSRQAALAQAYAEQLDLEAQLPAVMQAVARLQSGQLSLGDSLTAGEFLTAMELHIGRTQQALSGLPAAPATTVNWGKVLLWGGAALGGFWLLKSGSSTLVWIGLGVGGYLLLRNLAPTVARP
jgi:hypothetical protein